jgi:phage repressor protein C with HTH and peptisase S24 domain
MLASYDKRSKDASPTTMFVADRANQRRHAQPVLSSADILNALRDLKASGATTNAALGRLLGLPSSRIAEIFAGDRKVKVDEAKLIIEHFGLQAAPAKPSQAAQQRDVTSDIAMVGIRHADAQFGLGATFSEDHTEVEVLQFPKVWVESITYSPAELLSWVRGRGDSMVPTIHDGDMILLDHSQRRVEDQDELWAFTVGDTRAIKRLRVKGDRMLIFSDNERVPPDEEPLDLVRIVARVVFVGRRT